MLAALRSLLTSDTATAYSRGTVPKIESLNGVWLNARDVVSVGLPISHVFEDVGGDVSWRIAIEAPGTLVLRYVDGGNESFVVRKNDKIVAIGDHLYMSLQVRPGTPEGALDSQAADDVTAA